MKTNIACVVGALIATISISIAAPDKEAIIAKEKAVWKAFRDKDAGAVKKLVSTDVVAVYPDGIYNFQQRMDGMSKMTMKSFSLSDFNLSTPSDEIAIVSYKAKVESKDGSSSDLNCATVWNLKNGEWKAVFHSDMRAEK
jgi:ketosteroid isomerase-like protein